MSLELTYATSIETSRNSKNKVSFALGEVVLSKHIDSKHDSTVEGMGGEYYVTVTTAEGSQTTKLVVKR